MDDQSTTTSADPVNGNATSLSDDQHTWASGFTGVDTKGSYQSVDPDAGQPNQSVDPNASQPNQSADPNAAQPNQSVDPNAAQPNQSIDPNASQPNQSVDPNAAQPNQSVDPNAGQPNQSVDPNAGQSNQSVDPSAGQPNQSVGPSAGQPNQSVDPSAGRPSQSVDPNSGQPNQSVDPNAGQPNQSVDPNAGQPNQSVDPNAGQPNQSVDPNAGQPNQSVDPKDQATTGIDCTQANLDLPPPTLHLGATDQEKTEFRGNFLKAMTGRTGDDDTASYRDLEVIFGGFTLTLNDVVMMFMPRTLAGGMVPPDKSGPLWTNTYNDLLTIAVGARSALQTINLNLSPANMLDLQTVARSDVESFLSRFLADLGASQKVTPAVRITYKVRKIGDDLTVGLSAAKTKVASLLSDDRTLREPSELARDVARCLPDRIPAANFGVAADEVAKDYPVSPPQSLSDAVAKLIGPTVQDALSFLRKDVRDTIVKAIPDAVASGITAALKQALSEAPLSDQVKNSIVNSVEAAIKLKEDGPPMDRHQDSSGPGAPDRTPPPRTPPQAGPKPSDPKGQTIIKTPAIPIADVPKQAGSPDNTGGAKDTTSTTGNDAGENAGGNQPSSGADGGISRTPHSTAGNVDAGGSSGASTAETAGNPSSGDAGGSGATTNSSDTANAGNASGDVPASGGGGNSASNMISVTVVTSYDDSVRYWIQDVAIDENNETSMGQGRVLVNGDVHPGGDAISLTCVETINGAAICYQRESSSPENGGGGLTPWTHALISAGGTHTMIL